MYTDGKGERVVYKSYLVEVPLGHLTAGFYHFIVRVSFQRKNIFSKIKLVDLTGMNLRELITPTDASDPSWSGLLP